MDKSIIIPLLMLFSVSACSTYSLQELRHAKPHGSAFQTNLAKLYMDFSSSEEKDYDWQSSWYFADKGLLAVYGKDTAPEELKDWNLPKGELPALKKARTDLMMLLTPSAMAKNPQAAAQAQFYFDCWVEQQEENWQSDDIAYCRDNFIQSMAKLGSISSKKPVKVSRVGGKTAPAKLAMKKAEVAVKKSVEKPVTESVAATTTSFVLFFDAGSSEITPASEVTIGKAATPIAAGNDYAVTIIDKAKSKVANPELSQQRISAVKERLKSFGVKEAAIHSDADKKIDSKVKQKVEIFIND